MPHPFSTTLGFAMIAFAAAGAPLAVVAVMAGVAILWEIALAWAAPSE